ncbi:hypothetical protein BD626DRAFT_576413 [Schizophyllum amplum]|uniref:Uncharacterized protein n=1 Tax=Schizophyllum amplum TaxID=97359 RepID=A0A550BTL7_9AGAR|nr:hypothetical protein BD626DRAFT_576413 [Auriculariopsis ampla]
MEWALCRPPTPCGACSRSPSNHAVNSFRRRLCHTRPLNCIPDDELDPDVELDTATSDTITANHRAPSHHDEARSSTRQRRRWHVRAVLGDQIAVKPSQRGRPPTPLFARQSPPPSLTHPILDVLAHHRAPLLAVVDAVVPMMLPPTQSRQDDPTRRRA